MVRMELDEAHFCLNPIITRKFTLVRKDRCEGGICTHSIFELILNKMIYGRSVLE